jgi:hypothetical protein
MFVVIIDKLRKEFRRNGITDYNLQSTVYIGFEHYEQCRSAGAQDHYIYSILQTCHSYGVLDMTAQRFSVEIEKHFSSRNLHIFNRLQLQSNF